MESKCLNKVLVIDVETTGLDPQKHACIEIGAVLLDESLNPIDEFSSLLAPWEGAEIVKESMAVNKISQKELSAAKGFESVLQEFHQQFGTGMPLPWLAGWNVWFDIAFLQNHYRKAQLKWPFSFKSLDIQSLIRIFSVLRFPVSGLDPILNSDITVWRPLDREV